MTDSNRPPTLPLDPYLHNSTSWWWTTHGQHLELNSKFVYGKYQEWMREQGVVIRDPSTVTIDEQGIDFIDSESMTIFVLRWG
jgi:hypothetical protein